MRSDAGEVHPHPIYLDHSATTDLLPSASEAMFEAFRQTGNPSSPHPAGRAARVRLETARRRIVTLLKTGQIPPDTEVAIDENVGETRSEERSGNQTDEQPDERLIFTSGATESNHLAIHGIFASRQKVLRQRRPQSSVKLLVSSSEHASVMESALSLLDATEVAVRPELRTLPLHSDGVVDTSKLAAWCDDSTALVTVQWVSHETGVIQPLETIASICHARGVPLHIDAVAAVGKIPISLTALSAAAQLTQTSQSTKSSSSAFTSALGQPSISLAFAAHKFGGPCGIGGLWLQRLAMEPFFRGGSQEFGLRAGTEPVALAVGAQVALESEVLNLASNGRHVAQLQHRFESGILRAIPSAVVLADPSPRSPYLSAIAFPDGLRSTRWQSERSTFGRHFGKWLVHQLGVRGVYCATGSACTSDADEPSPTLPAMHLPSEMIHSTVRFSFSARQTSKEIDEAVRRVVCLWKEIMF